ncbi:MAG: ATP-binding protein [bacterium]
MKRVSRQNYVFNGSIRELMVHITVDMYTRQTLVSLFRCLLETIIESSYGSVILIKIKNDQSFQGLLNRLKYSKSKAYFYSEYEEIKEFKNIKLNNPKLENDEFLIIVAERFSASLFWDENISKVFGLCEGFCSLNPNDSRQIIDYLQSISFDESLEEDVNNIKQDRRSNENFTKILGKLVASLESRQRDLICANTELKELHRKTLQTEKLAAIGQLCSTIAHELRNPLSMIDLYGKIITKNVEKICAKIKDTKITDSLNNASMSICNASMSLEKLLTELLDYAKPMSIEKTKGNLEEALNQVINLVKPSYEEKMVELFFNYRLNDDISVNFDRIKLNQAFLNVVKNALDVSKQGDIIEVFVDCRLGDDIVYIKVKDQGPGILSQDKEKIFTPYFTTKKEGTGLGLANARKIMEAHQGSLIIISTSPKGTIFGLTLPIEPSYL